MTAANPHRGEVALELGEDRYRLRPSFSAIVAAEEELGPVFRLARRAGDGDIALGDVVALFHACLAEGPTPTPSREALGEKILARGLAAVLPTYRALLTQILTHCGGPGGDTS